MSRIVSVRSGGQTGADRAALDVAGARGLPLAGWVPLGGWAEDRPEPPGLLPDYPFLRETDSRDPAYRTRLNVRDSDATLIVDPVPGRSSPGTDLTLAAACEYGRPVFESDGQDAEAVIRWLMSIEGDIQLNVAGPRESEVPGTYAAVCSLLGAVFDRML